MVMYCILIGGWVRQMGAFVNTQQNTLTICAFYVGSAQKYVKQILSSSWWHACWNVQGWGVLMMTVSLKCTMDW